MFFCVLDYRPTNGHIILALRFCYADGALVINSRRSTVCKFAQTRPSLLSLSGFGIIVAFTKKCHWVHNMMKIATHFGNYVFCLKRRTCLHVKDNKVDGKIVT